MLFHWDFTNLKAEIEGIDPLDEIAELDVDAVMVSIDQSVDDALITSGEAQCLLLMLVDLQARGKKMQGKG